MSEYEDMVFESTLICYYGIVLINSYRLLLPDASPDLAETLALASLDDCFDGSMGKIEAARMNDISGLL